MSELTLENIIIREASLNDAKILFELSNDDRVRENSINTDKIEWENHVNWLKEKIISSNYYIYLFFYDKNFIGQVKFEIEDKEAIISISIVNEYRGKKLAAPMLLKGIESFLKIAKNVEKIVAYIRPENQSSIKSFNKVGFNLHEQTMIKKIKFNKYFLVSKNSE